MFPKDAEPLTEADIDAVLTTVRRQTLLGSSIEQAVRIGLIIRFGTNEQFLKLMRELDAEARAARTA